jgi:predicted ATPase
MASVIRAANLFQRGRTSPPGVGAQRSMSSLGTSSILKALKRHRNGYPRGQGYCQALPAQRNDRTERRVIAMSASLARLTVRNYRSLADLSLDISPVSVFFGPNGAGKSTILDTIWFFRDCAIRGVELASSTRSHGIGILYDGAADEDQLAIALATNEIEYELRFGLSSGRIEPSAGERLRSLSNARLLINRVLGSPTANLYHHNIAQHVPVTLREPEKLSLGLYLDFNQGDRQAEDLDRLLHFVRHYHSRSFFLHRLKVQGSDVSHETRLWDRGDNCWSVLRNLHDRRSVDNRYDTIVKFMGKSFPSFDGLVLEQTGPSTVYASFRERGRRKEIMASGVSDGHLQMLLLLTALFSEGGVRPAVLLFDEPEVSLHPWALSVFAEAVEFAAAEWNKQVLIATHSPVLLSQFRIDHVLATEMEEGRTRVRRLSEMDEIQDLLTQYAAGSLYMAQAVAEQAKPEAVSAEE